MKVGESGEISIILYSKPIRMKFTGKISAKLDAKGRVFFPAAFRKLLVDGEGDFVLRRDVYQPCLVVYPLVVWEEEVALLRQRLNRWDPRQAMVFRQFMSDAELISLDSSGRFLLPKQIGRASSDAASRPTRRAEYSRPSSNCTRMRRAASMTWLLVRT